MMMSRATVVHKRMKAILVAPVLHGSDVAARLVNRVHSVDVLSYFFCLNTKSLVRKLLINRIKFLYLP